MRFVKLPDDMDDAICALCDEYAFHAIEPLKGKRPVPVCLNCYRELQAKYPLAEAAYKGTLTRQKIKDKHEDRVWDFLRDGGYFDQTFETMATLLNDADITTSRGGAYSKTTVRRALLPTAKALKWDQEQMSLPDWLKQYQESLSL